MDPSATNSFEDQWRKALKEASETPPPSVWKGIEARLDEENDRGILPLWLQSPKVWYAAASVAALLLVGFGIWFSNGGMNDKKAEIEVATIKSAKSIDANAEVSKADNAPAIKNEKEELATKSSSSGTDLNQEKSSKSATNAATDFSGAKNPSALAKLEPSRKKAKKTSDSFRNSENPKQPNSPAIVAAPETITAAQVPDNTFADRANASHAAVGNNPENVSAELLNSLAYSDLDVHFQKRYVFFKSDLKEEEEVIEPAKNKEYWAAVGVMPASFNPDVRVKEAPMAFSNQSLSNKKAVTGSSESGVSYSVQTQGGVRISKHWSLELGLSYLKGNSDYQGGGYVLSANNSKAANVLENALADFASAPIYSVSNGDVGAGFANNGSIYIDVSKKVSNNYQYLQMPVQAGFTVNPDKKLSYSVLGGVAANFFLSNDLESASGETITTKASDEIYRSVNWAATTGLRLNYKLSSKWKASLTGSYQKAVSSGFRSNQSLESRPYLYGVAWGVRYSF